MRVVIYSLRHIPHPSCDQGNFCEWKVKLQHYKKTPHSHPTLYYKKSEQILYYNGKYCTCKIKLLNQTCTYTVNKSFYFLYFLFLLPPLRAMTWTNGACLNILWKISKWNYDIRVICFLLLFCNIKLTVKVRLRSWRWTTTSPLYIQPVTFVAGYSPSQSHRFLSIMIKGI